MSGSECGGEANGVEEAGKPTLKSELSENRVRSVGTGRHEVTGNGYGFRSL